MRFLQEKSENNLQMVVQQFFWHFRILGPHRDFLTTCRKERNDLNIKDANATVV